MLPEMNFKHVTPALCLNIILFIWFCYFLILMSKKYESKYICVCNTKVLIRVQVEEEEGLGTVLPVY